MKTKTESTLTGFIEALGNIRDQIAIEPIACVLQESMLKASDGSYSWIRKEAVIALGRLGENAADAIGAALRDKNFIVREEAAKALNNIGGEKAAGILVQALKYEELKDNVNKIQQIISGLKGNATEGEKGECPICGTRLKFWDASEVKCYFCGGNLSVEQGRLVEQISSEVTDSAEEKVIVYLHGRTGTNFVWPGFCCLCLTSVTASDYHKITAATALSMTAVAGRIEQELLQKEVEIPYCKSYRRKIKKPFGHHEQEAISMYIKVVGQDRSNVEVTLTFRNPQYAHLFRQANSGLIREGMRLSV